MADELNINVNAKLDPDASAVQINNGLDELYKSGKINPVNVSVKLDTDAIKSQTSQVQTQINNIAKANSSGFKVPIDFNVSADKIKEQLTTIVNKIRGGAKGQVIDFKVNLDEDGFLSDKSNVLIKYRNDANQVTESILKLKDTKEKLDDGTSDLRWTETLKSVSQNIEQTTKKAEQLTEVQQRLNQQLESLKITVNSFGDKNIGSLLDNNQLGTKYQGILSGLDSVSDSNGLTQVKNQFKELQNETKNYIQDQKTLKTESENTYKSQIQDLETLSKSEETRNQALQSFNQRLQTLKATIDSFGDKNVSSLLDNNQLGTQYQSVLDKLGAVGNTDQLKEVETEFKNLQTQTSQYANEQKVLQDETKVSYNTQIKDLETLTKSEAQRQATIEKTSQQITKISADYDAFKAKLSPTDVGVSLGKLNSENVGGLENAINTQDVEKATYYLSLLRSEYTKLNNEVKKPWANNAIEKLPENIEKATNSILALQSKFETLNTTGNSNFTNNFSSQIEKAKTNLVQLSESLDKINKEPDAEKQVQLYNSLSENVQKSNVQVNDLVKTYQTLNRIEASSGSFEKYVQQNPQVLKKHAQEVADIKNQWKQVAQETDITKLQTGFKEANTATSAFKGEIRSLGQEGRTVFGELGNDLKKIFQWTVSGGLLFGAIGQIKEGIQTINSLNKSMTDIQMITGMSASKVGNLTKQYSDLASQLHETTTSIMTASEEFLRAGNSADETASLLKASTVMSKIAGQTQEESAQSLISIMNAYKMKASDMMSVVDKLVAVDNTSATSTEELSTAIQKTAASAQESGVSFSQLVSWIGEVSSVSRQSADTIGTAFNSIFSRYEKVKAGANTDDQGEAVNDVEKVLKKFDISIRDQSNNFINLNTVLTEVANKWSTLNTVERGQISTALAGTKQRNQFLILMQNFNKTLELQSTEANSAGNAMNRYGTYATSTQAKIDDFINTLQKFWQNVVNSSVINGVVGAGTDVINVISGINSKLGAIPTLIGAITAALSVTKNVGKIYAYAA